MNTYELRRGNLIYNSSNNKEEIVEKIYTDGIVASGHLIHMDEIQGIPLTDERLIKFGLVKERNVGAGEKEHWGYYWMGTISLTIDLELSTSDHNYESISVDGSKKLEFVHQYQNLYFVLTGSDPTMLK